MNRFLSPFLFLLLLLAAAGSLCIGAVPLAWQEVWQGLSTPGYDAPSLIFLELRLPRTLLAMMAGAGLGMTGAMLQGWLRNPLADPGLLGTTACASLGGVIAIHFGLYAAMPLLLPISGMAGAMAGAILIVLLLGKHPSILTVILAGIALQSLAGALTALALNLAPNPHVALEIAFWLMGSVSDRSLTDVYLALPFLCIGMWLALRTRLALGALSVGEDTAISLGVDLRRAQRTILVATTLMVGPIAAVTGSIGFVGLVVPHLIRPLVGAQPGRLLVPCAIAGALLTLSADIAVRLIPASSELKLGVVTALLGAPFFFGMLLRQKGRLL